MPQVPRVPRNSDKVLPDPPPTAKSPRRKYCGDTASRNGTQYAQYRRKHSLFRVVRMSNEQNTLFSDTGTRSVSQREFAEIVGKSEGLVRKYLRQGKLNGDAIVTITGKPNRLALDAALAQWKTFHPDNAPETPATEDKSGWSEIHHERLRKERADADLAEYQAGIVKELYLHVDDIRETFGPMIVNAKQLLYQLETKLTPLLPGNPAENARIIRQHIDEICEGLMYVDPKAKRKNWRKAIGQASK